MIGAQRIPPRRLRRKNLRAGYPLTPRTIGPAIRIPYMNRRKTTKTVPLRCRRSFTFSDFWERLGYRLEDGRSIPPTEVEPELIPCDASEKGGQNHHGQRRYSAARRVARDNHDGLAFEEAAGQDGKVPKVLYEMLHQTSAQDSVIDMTPVGTTSGYSGPAPIETPFVRQIALRSARSEPARGDEVQAISSSLYRHPGARGS